MTTIEPVTYHTVSLRPHEIDMAAGVGVRRHISALRAGRPNQHGLTAADDGWRAHIEGACGELAVAKFAGLFWSGSVDTFRAVPDLGDAIEVRTRSNHNYDLIIRRADDPAKQYVHVTGQVPEFRIHGWITGGDARRDEFLRTYGGREPAWFVPASALNRTFRCIGETT